MSRLLTTLRFACLPMFVLVFVLPAHGQCSKKQGGQSSANMFAARGGGTPMFSNGQARGGFPLPSAQGNAMFIPYGTANGQPLAGYGFGTQQYPYPYGLSNGMQFPGGLSQGQQPSWGLSSSASGLSTSFPSDQDAMSSLQAANNPTSTGVAASRRSYSQAPTGR